MPFDGSFSDLPSVTRYYHYDGLKRLTDANHYPGAALTPSLTDTERSIVYDLNGNITALKRYASSGSGGNLTFTHTGNRMTSVTNANATGNDAGPKAFTYDANGNMTSDGRKGLELTWNILNLVDSAAMHGSSLKYAWLSDGTKVSAKADDGSGNGVQKRYLGSFVLTSNTEHSADEATEVESIAWDEGRIFLDVPIAGLDGGDLVVEDTTAVVVDPLTAWINYYRDCWFAGDHLGNVRSVIDITPDLIAPLVIEQSNYLPYGTRIQDQYFTSAMADNRWRFAGKEEQDFTPFSTLNLSLLDFGARMYDPFIARWTAVDPVANLSHSFGPFSYCAGNPIISRDRDGNFPETVWDVASLVMGVKSFVSNVKEGNVGGAILDGVGIIADAAAVLAPGIPGGAGAGIKAVRAGDKVADIVKGADKITDATKAIDNGKALSKAGNVAKTTTHSDDLKNVIYEVPGSATMDGKPYIGRTNDLSRRRHENRDGRDRTKAIVIGHYDPDVPKSGAIQEQKAINERGLDNLSNKRNEIKQSDWDRYGIR